jgi:cytochrome c-type biogenesis protein CcmF
VLQRLWWAACLALAAFLLTLAFAGWRVLPAVGFGGAFWLIGGAMADITDRAGLGRTRLANVWRRARGLPRSAWGAALAHAGMGVTLLGIAGMGLAAEHVASLAPGGSTRFAGYEWRLDSLSDVAGPNYTARRATITLVRDGKEVRVMEPSRRSFPLGRMTTTETAIHTNLVRDLYAVLGEEHDGRAVLRLHDNPLAPWIWLGALIMALGGALSLSDRRVRVAAPAAKRQTAEMTA